MALNDCLSVVWVFIATSYFMEVATTPTLTSAPCGRSKFADAGDGKALARPRIVGGDVMRPYEFPWQVSLRDMEEKSHFCGGAIISENWIITAAHCVEGVTESSIFVVVGEHDMEADSTVRNSFGVSVIVAHNEYNTPVENQNDIAMILIVGNITFNENVQPVCLPSSAEEYTGRKAYASGWGDIREGGPSSSVLQYTTLNITTNADCAAAVSDVSIEVTPDMVCTADNVGNNQTDTCQGDSGGPVTIKEADGTFRLIGLVSFGEGCAAGYPGVNARVSYFLDWIADVIANNSLSINECDSIPCQNGGSCTDEVNGYMCTCGAGYTGVDCETDINECDSIPCQNGGSCTDEVNGYMCTCGAGYTGVDCETDNNLPDYSSTTAAAAAATTASTTTKPAVPPPAPSKPKKKKAKAKAKAKAKKKKSNKKA